MHIERLDHVNVQTHDLEATCAFYVDVIGLRVGKRPPFGFPGYWLYDDAVPVIHLLGLTDADPPFTGGGAINHIAFRAAGLDAMRERLAGSRVAFQERIVPRTGELQIFLSDPNSVQIELTFAAAEVAGSNATAGRITEPVATSRS